MLITPSPDAEIRQEAPPTAPATVPVQAYDMMPPPPGYPGIMPGFTPPQAGIHPYMYGYTFPTPSSAWSGGYNGPYTYHTPVFDPAVVFQAYSNPPFGMSYQNSEVSHGRPSQSEPGNGNASSTQAPAPTAVQPISTESPATVTGPTAPTSQSPQGQTVTATSVSSDDDDSDTSEGSDASE